jgi:hypothetical protein
MTEWIVLTILLAGAWFWLDSHRVLDLARTSAKQFCEAQGLQLLDETVASSSIRLERNGQGQMIIARTYRFEFSDTGDNRLAGSIVMLGHKPGHMHLQPFRMASGN